jgi:hypothetical protein
MKQKQPARVERRLAAIVAVRKQNLWMLNVAQETAEAIRPARCAIELDEMDEAVLCRGAMFLHISLMSWIWAQNVSDGVAQ